MLWYFILGLFAVLGSARPSPQQQPSPGSAAGFWMGSVQRQGTIGYGKDSAYKVFRNVKDYGAVGDGTADDTDAINKAIADGKRCFYDEGSKTPCDSSTTSPALVYFPPGTYQISKPLVMYYYTQMVGDAVDLPVIRAASNFEGFAMLDANPYIPGGWGANWYTNQNNFYRQVRNFVIDMTHLPPAQGQGGDVWFNGIHWQVAQATSLQNIRFELKKGGNNLHRGIFTENGSGGWMSDLVFNGGAIAMSIGSQQFTIRNITINDSETAIFMIWNWLWTFKSININNVQTGFNLSSLDDKNQNQTVGAAVIMDTTFKNTKNAIVTSRTTQSQPKTGGSLMLYNVDFEGATNAVVYPDGKVLVPGGAKVDSWAQGDAYMPAANSAKVKRMPQALQTSTTCGKVVTETVYVTPGVSQSTPVASQTVSDSAAVVAPASSSASQPAVSPTSQGVTGTTLTRMAPSAGASSSVSNAAPPVRPSASSSPIRPNPNNSTAGTPPVSNNGTCSKSAVQVVGNTIQQALTKPTVPKELLGQDGGVFQRSKPQYETVPASSFISVKSKGAKGDGTTDDTAAIQQVLNEVTGDQVVYFDHGAYLITDTVLVPKNVRITGEIWPIIMVSGQKFSDPNNPVPAFRIGMPGDSGAVEISDLIFETRGPTPGAIMMEWNVAQAEQGSCGMWDTHFRVGGTAGTLLQQDLCQNTTTQFVPECAASFLMMHVTEQANAYFENTWFWLADHELDMSPWNKLNIYNGRGILVESKGPTWLWGTSSEHHVLYNYQISNAQNVFMGAIQTETPYFQAAPNALQGGFTPSEAWNDPTFEHCTTEKCKKAWGLRVVNSEDIFMFGGGLYSFFEGWNQACVNTEDCQENMIDIQCSSNVYLAGLVTKASTSMINVNGKPTVSQADHSSRFGSTLILFEQQ